MMPISQTRTVSLTAERNTFHPAQIASGYGEDVGAGRRLPTHANREGRGPRRGPGKDGRAPKA